MWSGAAPGPEVEEEALVFVAFKGDVVAKALIAPDVGVSGDEDAVLDTDEVIKVARQECAADGDGGGPCILEGGDALEQGVFSEDLCFLTTGLLGAAGDDANV